MLGEINNAVTANKRNSAKSAAPKNLQKPNKKIIPCNDFEAALVEWSKIWLTSSSELHAIIDFAIRRNADSSSVHEWARETEGQQQQQHTQTHMQP